MMSLPFVAAALAIAAGWSGRSGGATALAILAVGLLLALFAVHATSSVDISL